METKIKGHWLQYDYSIDCWDQAVQGVLDALPQYEHLGKSKVIRTLTGEVTQLKRRHQFFKLKRPSLEELNSTGVIRPNEEPAYILQQRIYKQLREDD